MKHRIVWTIAFAVFSLGLAATASAQGHQCVTPGLVGEWAYTETGTVMVPSPTGSVSVVAAAVGKYDFDRNGNFTGTQYSSAGGTVVEDLKLGTYSVGPVCTGTLTIQIFDPSGSTLRRTSVWAIVLADNTNEFRGIMTSMVLPNGVALSPIMTITGKRISPDRSNQN